MRKSILVVSFLVAAVALSYSLKDMGSNSKTLDQPHTEKLNSENINKTPAVTLSKEKSMLSKPEAKKTSTITIEDFRKFLMETRNELPTRQDVKAYAAEDIHHANEALIKAGSKLGRIVATLEKDPSLIKEALYFYEDCALDQDILNSVRALCFSNLERWHKILGNESEINTDPIPEHIRNLARDLKDF